MERVHDHSYDDWVKRRVVLAEHEKLQEALRREEAERTRRTLLLPDLRAPRPHGELFTELKKKP